jgi:putative chitinase
MAKLDEATLFDYLRRAPFGGRLTQQQMEGTKEVIKAWDATDLSGDLRQLAYVFATAFHETGATMQPVEENLNYTSTAGIRRVWPKRFPTDADAKPFVRQPRRLANKVYGGRMGNKQPDDGWVYRGRGLVQITGRINYRRMGERISVPLEADPSLATNATTSAFLLVIGMIEGIYTGKRLAQYFAGTKEDPIGARAIINGTDKAQLIAGHYKAFLGALQAADTATPLPTDVNPDAAKPDAPPLATDKVTLGALSAVGGAGGIGALFQHVNTWQGFAAFALVVVLAAVGAWAFFTGRLDIRRKAGA